MTVTERTMTQGVVQYVHRLTYEEIPSDVRRELTRCLVDGIGVVLSGAPAACSQSRSVVSNILTFSCAIFTLLPFAFGELI